MRGMSRCSVSKDTKSILLFYSLSLLSLKAPQSPIPDMVLATSKNKIFVTKLTLANLLHHHEVGSAVVLIFGTQRDVLRAWMFCRRKPREIRNATSSEHLVALEPKTSSLSIGNEKSNQESMYSDRQVERKSKFVTTKEISLPVLRGDLTFPSVRNLRDIEPRMYN